MARYGINVESSAGWILWGRTPYRGPHVVARNREVGQRARAVKPSAKQLTSWKPYWRARRRRTAVTANHGAADAGVLAVAWLMVSSAAISVLLSPWAKSPTICRSLAVSGPARGCRVAGLRFGREFGDQPPDQPRGQ
jgi:hypothetical protein